MKNAIWTNIFRNWQQTESKTVMTLKQVPIFKGLSEREFLEIETIIHERAFHPKEIIFKRQAPGEAMYIIMAGDVEIYIEDHNDNKNVLATLEQGDFFGELALLDNETRSATAAAIESSTILVFSQTDLESLIERKPSLGNKILLNLARVTGARLRKTNELLAVTQKESA
ncbi:MAG: cyclic nucleotide-binding domain-containing protein [Candidatus Marinimicrobia bacterium]|nr:cyclic nucleotide-binding domain-containing protein [Candidatus Neomarinimicrobiota bacterium]